MKERLVNGGAGCSNVVLTDLFDVENKRRKSDCGRPVPEQSKP